MHILRARLGFAALQMFPEDKRDEISSFVFRVGTRGGIIYSGTTGDCDEKSLLFKSAKGVIPDHGRPVSAGVLYQSAYSSSLSCIWFLFFFLNQGFKEVLLLTATTF